MAAAEQLYSNILDSYNQTNGPRLSRDEFANNKLKSRIRELSDILIKDDFVMHLLEENKKHDMNGYMHMLRVGVSYDCMMQLHSELVKGIKRDTLEIVGFAHDAGKIYIPDYILKKPTRLTAYEFEIMKCHNMLSITLLRKLEHKYPNICEIAIEHHPYPRTGRERRQNERRKFSFGINFDRRGCNDRRGNERRRYDPEIKAAGKILSICDIFDALSSPRAYKVPWDRQEVLKNLEEEFKDYKDMIKHLHLMFLRNN